MDNCSICGGTGLVPSKALGKFSGKPIPNCFTKCECQKDEPEHYHPFRPEDFDFPMSYSFYRSLCQQHGWQDPGPDRPLEPKESQSQVVIHRTSDMGAKEFDLLQQTALKTDYLEKKLTEHLEYKKKPQPVKSGRGIKIE